MQISETCPRLRNRSFITCITTKIIEMATKKYSTKASEKIGKVMHEFKEGELKSSSGDKVTDKKQAIAIGISEAKEEGLKVPKKTKK